MPTIDWNINNWNERYDWKQAGDEWSSVWGGTHMEWYAVVLPRIHAFIPVRTILQIGPGFGRWTQFLKDSCDKLILVDLSEKCIQACKARFSDYSDITYYVNDGKYLEMISDNSIDFVFSFESLVHAEEEVIQFYLNQIARKLTKDGVSFIHHSNIGEYSIYFPLIKKIKKRLPYKLRKLFEKFELLDDTDHDRAYSMTARKFFECAEKADLQCISQEILNWYHKRLIDCLSVVVKKDSVWARPNRIMRNVNIAREMRYISKLSRLYGLEYFKNNNYDWLNTFIYKN